MQVLPELDHNELHEYVDSFKTSSDRSRTALYVVIVATVLIAIAHYNTLPWSFAQHRLRHWYEIYHIAKGNHSLMPQELLNGDFDQLRVASEEYLRQYTDRATLATSPIPGVWVDANDIGLFGGFFLLLLMGVLAVCMRREHANLHLSLYKVRRLYDVEVERRTGNELYRNPGDSPANFLYHALAMRQVLSTPPTLARANIRPIRKALNFTIFLFVFLFPALGYSFVVWTNRATSHLGKQYDMDINRINSVQWGLLLVILLLCVYSFGRSFDMSKQWRRAFLRINPQRRLLKYGDSSRPRSLDRDKMAASPEEPESSTVPQASALPSNNRLTLKSTQERYWKKRIRVTLAESLRDLDRQLPAEEITIAEWISATAPITHLDLDQMVSKVMIAITKGQKGASEQLSRNGSLVLTRNDLRDGKWTIAGQWIVRPNPNLVEPPVEPSERP